MADSVLELRGIGKSYPGVKALSEVSLDVKRGEVHALVGENGAGKSTLGRIACGLTQADEGRMLLRGEAYRPASRPDAQKHGVGMVMQELNLIPTLTVAENIFLGRMPRRLGFVDYRRINSETLGILRSLGLEHIAPDRMVSSLGVGQQQMVEIAGVLSRKCDVLVLDEPTAALTARETEQLFGQIRRLRSEGVAIVYVSHRMEEIKRIADRITVLRDGKWVATRLAAETEIDEVIRLMVGRELGEASTGRSRAGGAVALRVNGLRRATAVRGVSFEARRGEILGFAGLMGSGRTETMRLIFAADKPDGGEVYLHGSDLPARIRSPREAVRSGIALLTEDRKQQGLLLPMTIRANVTLPKMSAVARLGGWINRRQERIQAEWYGRLLSLRARSVEQAVGELSGGNQQKAVIARWLYRDCEILIFDEPTRGIDIGAKFEIYRLLNELAEQGKAIVVVSSDLPELMAISDRIAVMSAGRIAATFERGQWTQDRIMAAALSGYGESGGSAGR